ncbi:unnamed protein product [Arabis nemorensis]|uniref:Uncharacterized protein n=1 Tax=Arabis nemorensis TaxID=586526 RepID=A0A565CC86_9BRAS|nr:unnamed protein product [Arabis nemorensis]
MQLVDHALTSSGVVFPMAKLFMIASEMLYAMVIKASGKGTKASQADTPHALLRVWDFCRCTYLGRYKHLTVLWLLRSAIFNSSHHRITQGWGPYAYFQVLEAARLQGTENAATSPSYNGEEEEDGGFMGLHLVDNPSMRRE